MATDTEAIATLADCVQRWKQAYDESQAEKERLYDALERINSAGGVETRYGGQIAGAMKEIAHTALYGEDA